MFSRPFEDKSRPTVLLVVALFHSAIVLLLLKEAERHFAAPTESEPLIVDFLSRAISHHDAAPPATNKVPQAQAAANSDRASTNAAANAPAVSTVIPTPPSPLIDWTHEAEISAQDALAKAQTDEQYRNLAGLSASQLELAHGMHLAPINADSAFEFRHDSHCLFIGPVLFCEMKIGKRKIRGDIFKNMHKFLDERLTDPLP